MNIFATSPSPVKSAQALDDKRVVKMCLETTQIVSTVLRGRGIATRYKPTHVNHPVTLWSHDNLLWTYNHGLALCAEYTVRYGREHSCLQVLTDVSRFIPDEYVDPDDYCNCARNNAKGVDFTHVSNVHRAYRLYLKSRWATDNRLPQWTNRNPPRWARA